MKDKDISGFLLNALAVKIIVALTQGQTQEETCVKYILKKLEVLTPEIKEQAELQNDRLFKVSYTMVSHILPMMLLRRGKAGSLQSTIIFKMHIWIKHYMDQFQTLLSKAAYLYIK